MAAYRFFLNHNITKAKIISALKNHCLENIKNMENKEHILVIQDTSEFNFKDHAMRIKKKTKNPRQVSHDNPGIFCHNVIALGAESNNIYGIPYTQIYNWDPKRERNSKNASYKKKPVTECESFRWIKTIKKCSNLLSSTAPITILSDREGDIYELLATKLKPNTNILVRACQDRRLADSEIRLNEHMERCPIAGSYEFMLLSRGHGHKARMVKLVLKFDKITIRRPPNCVDAKKRNVPVDVTLNCVYAKEISVPPAGEKPIEWRLLTTHEITDFTSASKCVEWYRKRWYIEEVFRVMKRQGLGVEDAQLENLDNLAKLTLLSLIAASRVVSLKTAFDLGDEQTSAQRDFTEQEVDVLKNKILPKVEGKTKIQKNPYREKSLAWAAWIIARIGGWSGYLSQSKPGYITFKRGLDKFNIIMEYESVF